MAEIFFIPCGNNKLTQNDIDNGCLRITKENKKYFPDEDCDNLIIIINNIEYPCLFRVRAQGRQDRSAMISIGKELMNKLDMKTLDILECQKVGDKKYTISK